MAHLIDELNDLHASYVDAINFAVSEGDPRRADDLAQAYDDDAVRLVAEREGRTDMLPIHRPEHHDTPLRRLVHRLAHPHAA